jgi:L-alanine-DL-glutamate epimerase-like enolase superfamily enzyme
MRIAKIEVIPFNLPYKREIVWATGVLKAAEHLLVKIVAEDGTYGVAEAIPRVGIYGDNQEGIYFALTKHLIPAIIGMDSMNLEGIWRKMDFMFWNLTSKGAIDVALHDLNGKLLGVSTNRLLGGPVRDRVALSWQVAFASHDEMFAEMDAKLAEGYKAFKVKGGPHPDEDIELLRKMRAHVPEGVRLYIDANITYDRTDTRKVLKALEGVIDCLEEPMRPSDENGRRTAFEGRMVPILSDESGFTLPDVYYQIQRRQIDIVGLKIPRTGFTISRKILAVAEAANVPAMIGTQADSTLGVAAALQLASAFPGIKYPCELAYYVDNIAESVIDKELTIEDGCLLVPDGPGNGVDIDWERLERFRVKKFDY